MQIRDDACESDRQSVERFDPLSGSNVKYPLVSLVVACGFVSPAQGACCAAITNSSDRFLGFVLSIMFLAGVALAYGELAKWWTGRMGRQTPPPFANLITYDRDSLGRWRATQVLWYRLSSDGTIFRHAQLSIPGVEEDQKQKAA